MLFRLDGEDGGVVTTTLRLTMRISGLRMSRPRTRAFSPESLGGSSARMVVVAADPDALFDKAVAAGASVVSPMADQPYGWRVGRVVDPYGHHWEIGRPLPKTK